MEPLKMRFLDEGHGQYGAYLLFFPDKDSYFGSLWKIEENCVRIYAIENKNISQYIEEQQRISQSSLEEQAYEACAESLYDGKYDIALEYPWVLKRAYEADEICRDYVKYGMKDCMYW